MVSVDQRIGRWRSQSEAESAASPQLAALLGGAGGYQPPATSSTAVAASNQADSSYQPPAAPAVAAATQSNSGVTVDDSYVPPPKPAVVANTPPTPAPAPSVAQTASNSTAPAVSSNQAATQTAAAPMASITPRYGRYMARSNVNVRAAPDRNSARVGQLASGEEVISLGQVIGADWLMVNLANGSVGYVASPFLVALDGSAGGGTAVAQAPAAQAQQAALTSPTGDLEFGNYYALVIGNNDYASLPDLETAVNDAQRVSEILRQHYGFQVQTLINATRADIVVALDRLRSRLKPSDNLLIYYGGHGILDTSSERGYWLPVDATTDTQVSWVSNATITDTLKAMEANHIMLVVDSCFSGTLTRAVTSKMQTPTYYQKMIKKRARGRPDLGRAGTGPGRRRRRTFGLRQGLHRSSARESEPDGRHRAVPERAPPGDAECQPDAGVFRRALRGP